MYNSIAPCSRVGFKAKMRCRLFTEHDGWALHLSTHLFQRKTKFSSDLGYWEELFITFARRLLVKPEVP